MTEIIESVMNHLIDSTSYECKISDFSNDSILGSDLDQIQK